MSTNNITVPIRGMHCASCEILIGEKLKKLPGVKDVNISHKDGKAHIKYENTRPSDNEIAQAVHAAGYDVGDPKKLPWFSNNSKDYIDLAKAAVLLYVIYILAKQFGIFDLTVNTEEKGVYVALMVGLVAGISTCMALIGGLVLGLSARHAELHPEATTVQKFRPHLFFNLGRIGGYAFLGGIIGFAGQSLNLSQNMLGFLTMAVGAIMLFFGLKLIEIFPILHNKTITLPTGIAKFFGLNKDVKEYSAKNAIVLGALTFFLPCGFTQTMQIYAISSGSFTKGAMIMGMFALGTAPGLLSIGGLAAFLKGRKARVFFATAGLAVIILGWANITNGKNLMNFGSVVQNQNIVTNNEVQIVKMTQGNGGYSPNTFTIEMNRPVKWIITSTNQYSCASSLVMPKYGINKVLTLGENIVTFTPTQAGEIPFSCSMGMYRGKFIVVDKGVKLNANTQNTANNAQLANGATCGTSGGCGCGSSFIKRDIKDAVPTEAENIQAAQVIKAVYENPYDDIRPSSFTVKKGQPVRFEIDVQENGYGCMNTIMIPGLYDTPQVIKKGEDIVMTFTPTQTGSYDITCAMGMPRGDINVIE